MSRGKPNGFDHSGPPAFEPLVDFEFIDLQDKPVPQTEWLCLGWIPKRRVTLLYGPDNTGKTPLAQQLQTATALGSEWLGMKVERVRSFGLYCEDDVNDIHARQAAINQYYQCEMLDLELMRAAARLEANSNALIDFSDNDEGRVTLLYHQLEELCADEGVQLLILDPLAELFIAIKTIPPMLAAPSEL